MDLAEGSLAELLSSGYKNFGRLLELATKFLLSYSKIGMESNIRILNYIFDNSMGKVYYEAAFLLGVYHYRNCKFPEADNYFNVPGIEESQNPKSYRIHSSIHQRKFDLAEGLIREGLSYWKHNPDAVQGRATIRYDSGDYMGCKTCYLDYVTLAPDLTASHFLLGRYYKNIEQNFDLAKKTFEHALQVIRRDKLLKYCQYYLPTEHIEFDLKGDYLEVLKELGENETMSSLLSSSGYKDYRLAWQLVQYWEEKEWKKCDQLLQKLYKTTSKQLERRYYSFMRGETFFRAGDFNSAKSAYLESLHIGESVWMPDFDEYVSIFLCQDLDSPTLDMSFLDIALGMDRVATISILVSKLSSLGMDEEVIKIGNLLDRKLDDPLFMLSYFSKANINLGRVDLAIAQLEQMIEMLPSHEPAKKLLDRLVSKPA